MAIIPWVLNFFFFFFFGEKPVGIELELKEFLMFNAGCMNFVK